MAKFKGAVKQCVVCDVSFKVPACRAEKAICCSRKCKDKWWSATKIPLAVQACKGCGKEFKEHVARMSKRVFCSVQCKRVFSSTAARPGKSNSNWKGGVAYHADGYRYLSAPSHPLSGGRSYVFEHRLVMEKWLIENDPESPFLEDLNGVKVLNQKIVVHHRNGGKLDNSISNLECMTKSQHRRHHQNDPLTIKKQIAKLEARLKLIELEK